MTKNKRLAKKLRSIHAALDDCLGDSDVTHLDDDDEREQVPGQWAARELIELIEYLETVVGRGMTELTWDEIELVRRDVPLGDYKGLQEVCDMARRTHDAKMRAEAAEEALRYLHNFPNALKAHELAAKLLPSDAEFDRRRRSNDWGRIDSDDGFTKLSDWAGMLPHDGSDSCPVWPDEKVEFSFVDGSILRIGGPATAGNLVWSSVYSYRVVNDK